MHALFYNYNLQGFFETLNPDAYPVSTGPESMYYMLSPHSAVNNWDRPIGGPY